MLNVYINYTNTSFKFPRIIYNNILIYNKITKIIIFIKYLISFKFEFNMSIVYEQKKKIIFVYI